jgi:hypothetical protein
MATEMPFPGPDAAAAKQSMRSDTYLKPETRYWYTYESETKSLKFLTKAMVTALTEYDRRN